ncbi:MAG TPA: HD domain-containing phosphohydrolase, partial [Bdellovibrionota bacterium]|nr:HD domain-containing phosphohydrolase [Bdellovibrionota bacterium]
VSISGLLHDVGMKELSREIVDKPRHALSATEKTLMESHTVRGAEILNQMPNLPSDAAIVAMQHQEDCAGFGYPRALTKSKIHPMARLISVADVFCEYAIQGPTSKGMNARQAVETLMQFNRDRLDPDFFGGLLKLFKLGLKNGGELEDLK